MAETAAPDTILSVRGLTRRFGGLLAVNSVDLDLPRGQVLALIGPNGAGKSTFVNLLTGVYAKTSGTVQLEGRELTGLSPSAIARAGLVRTFQNGRLFSRLTVIENVMTGADGRSRVNLFDAVARTPRFRTEERNVREQALTLLGELRKRGATAKIIFVSGYAEEAFSRNLPEGEEFAFLPKPFSLKQLIEAVKGALG